MSRSGVKSCEAGFTLIEAMASVAVMAAIVAAMATIAGQWLPHWGRGLANLQRADLLGLGVERIAADVAAAEYVAPNGGVEDPLFDGLPSSVTFVRSAIGPNSPSGLETVRISEIEDGRSFSIVRVRAPFAPSLEPVGLTAFTDPVVLVRTPFRVIFAYAGADRRWRETWEGNKRLPDAVRLTVRNGAGGRVFAASTAVAIRVTAPAQDKSKTSTVTQLAPSTATIAGQPP